MNVQLLVVSDTLLKEKGFSGVTLFNFSNAEQAITQCMLGNYRYEPYKTDVKSNLETISLIGDEDAIAASRGTTIARARNFSRDLVNAPADDIYPESLADAALGLASR